MKRNDSLDRIKNTSQWDILVIGGGASGLGTALDAASRGYSTLLLERGDFAQETSSRSTKLIHGGVRYLKEGRLWFVHESLQERAFLLQNAPHLVHKLPFILPAYNEFERLFYYGGLKLYDALAGKLSIGKTELLSKNDTLKRIPTLQNDKLCGSVCYYDAQFDDSRLAINLAQTIVEQDGCVINYMEVIRLLKENDQVNGVIAKDLETQIEYEIHAKVVINATGAFVDSIRRLDDKNIPESVVPSQGAHIVLDRSFLPSDTAVIIPYLSNNQVLFAIPWHNRVLVGTTDTLISKVPSQPKPLAEEIDYLLTQVGKYLIKKPVEADILSSFAGIRPLIKPKGLWKSTSNLSRGHLIMISNSKLISVTGGKWTTYRKIGESTTDTAAHIANLPLQASRTKNLRIHGWNETRSQTEWQFYGSDESLVEQLPFSKEKLHPDLPCRPVDVIWAVRHEMARKVIDVIARRNRSQFLNSAATLEIAPKVAELMSQELGTSFSNNLTKSNGS